MSGKCGMKTQVDVAGVIDVLHRLIESNIFLSKQRILELLPQTEFSRRLFH